MWHFMCETCVLTGTKTRAQISLEFKCVLCMPVWVKCVRPVVRLSVSQSLSHTVCIDRVKVYRISCDCDLRSMIILFLYR